MLTQQHATVHGWKYRANSCKVDQWIKFETA